MAHVLAAYVIKRTPHMAADAESRHRFADVFQPRPLRYWSDLLTSAGIGWSAFVVSTQASPGSLLYIGGTLSAIMTLLRAAIFIHELAHLKRRTLPGFAMVWNLLVGFPLMLPSLLYVGSHKDHHRQATFGTVNDPEYAPLATWSGLRIVGFVGIALTAPLLLALRWGVLGPFSCFIPPLRRYVIERGSSLVINPSYRRPAPYGQQAVGWLLQESATAAVFWIVVIGVAMDWLALRWPLQWYIVAAGVVLINQIRTLAAHRYDNDGRPLDSTGQLLDSLTLGGWPFTVLAAPVGLRYHALHHALPTVPYHNLGILHRRLLAELPSDSPYHRTQQRGILSAICQLLWRKRQGAPSALLSENHVSEGA